MNLDTYFEMMSAAHDKINQFDSMDAVAQEMNRRVKETITHDNQDVRIVIWDDLATVVLGVPSNVVGAVGALAEQRIILMNEITAKTLTPEQYRAVVYHELGHIHYNDTTINIDSELRADQFSVENTSAKDLHSALTTVFGHIKTELSEMMPVGFIEQSNLRLDKLQAMCS